MRGARRQQRGFLLDPFRFGQSCAEEGFAWTSAAVASPDGGANGSILAAGDGVFLALRASNGATTVYRSLDSGRTFSGASLGGSRDPRALLHLGGSVWMLVLGNTFASTISLRSVDGGATWSAVTHGASGYYYGADYGAGLIRLARYGAVGTRVSADLGVTWADGPPLPAAVNTRSMRYFGGYWWLNVVGSSTVYRLDEAAGTWSLYTGLGGAVVNGFLPANGRLFIATDAGLYVTDDLGATVQLAASTVGWAGHLHGRVWWHAGEEFYFCITRADASSPSVLRASYDGLVWFAAGSSPPVAPGSTNQSAWDGTTLLVGWPRLAANALYYGECA